LQGTGGHLELAISDSGIGFDVNEARASRGLGLVSMRERILALKGTIFIESQPMHGTKVSARVPMNIADGVDRRSRRAVNRPGFRAAQPTTRQAP
jgi:signal transduction histidine kinase